jgi:hypothetical protein
VIDGNVRPRHMRITPDGEIKLISFGSAYFAWSEPPHREPDEYAAPEQLLYMEGRRISPDLETDRYSLASAMNYGFCGQHRFLSVQNTTDSAARLKSAIFARKIPLRKKNERHAGCQPRKATILLRSTSRLGRSLWRRRIGA